MSDQRQVNGHLLRTVKPFEGEDVRSVAMRYAALKRLTVARLLRSGLAMDRGHLTSLPLKRDRIEVLAVWPASTPTPCIHTRSAISTAVPPAKAWWCPTGAGSPPGCSVPTRNPGYGRTGNSPACRATRIPVNA